ncbi:MAG: cyclophilin-like fold protein [Ruminococcus sp.]|nr:cyclophilin-like fold protein [Ruminococcus sp.]
MSLNVKHSKTLKLKNTTKKVSFKITSGKTVIRIKRKSNTSITITGLKKGTAKIRAVLGKKSYTCKVSVKSYAKLLKIKANGYTFKADFMNNSSAKVLKKKLQKGSITIKMNDYGNFEKVGDLPFSLPTNDKYITTSPGDVILYQGNQLTIYYDTNSWEFTKVAKIRGDNSTLKQKLGDGNVTVILSLV